MKVTRLMLLPILLLMGLSLSTAASDNSASIPDQNSNPKISDALQKELPAPLYSPLVFILVDIYLKDDKTDWTTSLQPYVTEVLHTGDGVVEAKVRADRVQQIADLPFVSYIGFPRQSTMHIMSIGGEQSVKKDPKICSFLAERVGPKEGRPPIQGIAGGTEPTVLVDVYLNDALASGLDDLRPHLKTLKYAEDNVIEAEVSLDEVTNISDMPFVSYISLPRVQYRKAIGTGLVLSEAVKDNIMHTKALYDGNITGKGVTVAVVDANFFCDKVSRLELPTDFKMISSKAYSDNQIHGTACAEIISDVAPNINLVLLDSGITWMDFIAAVENLSIQNPEVDVVSCSMDFLTGKFDGEDELCLAVRNLTRKGTVWVNAAGNEAQRHWGGNFTDTDADDKNEFSDGDESINITAQRGETVNVIMSWEDDWSHATQDYDLYVYSPRGGFAASENPQSGLWGHTPEETVSFKAPVSGIYEIEIKKTNATRDDVRFNLFVDGKDLDEYQVVEGSLGGVLACSRDVITVGVVDASTLELEPYSSHGPTADGRMKPDVVAPDNVSTSSYFPKGFKGTSAAAPHMAGCLALLQQKYGNGNPGCDLRTVLVEGAVDLGHTGPDNAYGYGLVDVSVARCE